MYSHLERTIPHKTVEGNEYLIKFEIFPPDSFPVVSNIPVVYLTLVQVKNVTKNGRRFFYFLAQYIADYVRENNVVLFYYCDHGQIEMRANRSYSPQEYRHKVFNFAYNTIPSGTLTRLPIIIEDEEHGTHYMTLISTRENEEDLEQLKISFEEHYQNQK